MTERSGNILPEVSRVGVLGGSDKKSHFLGHFLVLERMGQRSREVHQTKCLCNRFSISTFVEFELFTRNM